MIKMNVSIGNFFCPSCGKQILNGGNGPITVVDAPCEHVVLVWQDLTVIDEGRKYLYRHPAYAEAMKRKIPTEKLELALEEVLRQQTDADDNLFLVDLQELGWACGGTIEGMRCVIGLIMPDWQAAEKKAALASAV